MGKRFFRLLFLLVLVALLMVGTFFILLFSGAFGKIPSKAELKEIKNETASVVYSSDQQLLGKFFAENRTNIKYPELPEHLINALIATEDARFFEHEGIDKRSMVRVLIKTLLLGDRSAGGGSTITQQLAKNLFGREDYGRFSIFINKFKEIVLAGRLEEIYTKEEILTLYLNTVPFGEDIYGVEVAAHRFFDKKTKELLVEEAAVLVGILKANTFYNPRLYPENALERRNIVLAQMEKYNYLKPDLANSLKGLPLLLNYSNLNKESPAPYFLVHVRKEAEKIIDDFNAANGTEYSLEKDGLIINTTLNKEIQLALQQSVKKQLSSFQAQLRKIYSSGKNETELENLAKQIAESENLTFNSEIKKREFFSWDSVYVKESSILDSLKYSLTQLHSGAIALNAQTGAVLAWYGGIDFQKYPYDQVTAKRQLASTFKPILYAAAIEKGAKACDYLENDRLILTDYNNWQPENYDGEVGGKYSLAAALAFSKNIPTVNLFFQLGFEKLKELWISMGFSSELENKPSVSLGTVSASLMELSEAYSSFPNLGEKVESYLIEEIKTDDGVILYQHKQQKKREKIFSKETALKINEILAKASNEGTGTAMRNTYGIDYPIAGKTGTSQNFSDAWYVCYNNDYIFAVRVGAAFPSIHFQSGAYGSGSRLALPILGMTLRDLKNTLIGKQLKSAGLETSDEINCPDFKKDSAIESIMDIFSSPTTTREKEEKKQERKKKRKDFFDRLFGK